MKWSVLFLQTVFSTRCFTYKDFISDGNLENTAKRQRLFPQHVRQGKNSHPAQNPYKHHVLGVFYRDVCIFAQISSRKTTMGFLKISRNSWKLSRTKSHRNQYTQIKRENTIFTSHQFSESSCFGPCIIRC